MPLTSLNEQNFEAEVAQSALPVVIDIWGPQCAECGPLLRMAEALAPDYEGRLKIVQLNMAEARHLCAKLRVRGLPAFLVFKDGKEVARMGRELTPANLKENLDRVLAGVED